MTSINLKTSFFLFAFCLFAIACNSEKAEKQELRGNPNILPVDANAKEKKEIDLKQTGKRKKANQNTGAASNEPFEWNAQTEKEFMTKCETSMAARKNIDSEKYCPCILDLLKPDYSANQLNKAIQDNPQKAAGCLRAAILQE